MRKDFSKIGNRSRRLGAGSESAPLVLPESRIIQRTWVVHGLQEPERSSCHKNLPPTIWELHYASFEISSDFVLVATFYKDESEQKVLKHRLIVNNASCTIQDIHGDLMDGALFGVYYEEKLIHGFFMPNKKQRDLFKSKVLQFAIKNLENPQLRNKEASGSAGATVEKKYDGISSSSSLSSSSSSTTISSAPKSSSGWKGGKLFHQMLKGKEEEGMDEDAFYLVYITILSAKDLDFFDLITENDPFVQIDLMRYNNKEDDHTMLHFKEKAYTETIWHGGSFPVWSKKYKSTFLIVPRDGIIDLKDIDMQILVMDRDLTGDNDIIGGCTVSMSEYTDHLLAHGMKGEFVHNLFAHTSQSSDGICQWGDIRRGSLKLKIECVTASEKFVSTMFVARSELEEKKASQMSAIRRAKSVQFLDPQEDLIFRLANDEDMHFLELEMMDERIDALKSTFQGKAMRYKVLRQASRNLQRQLNGSRFTSLTKGIQLCIGFVVQHNYLLVLLLINPLRQCILGSGGSDAILRLSNNTNSLQENQETAQQVTGFLLFAFSMCCAYLWYDLNSIIVAHRSSSNSATNSDATFDESDLNSSIQASQKNRFFPFFASTSLALWIGHHTSNGYVRFFVYTLLCACHGYSKMMEHWKRDTNRMMKNATSMNKALVEKAIYHLRNSDLKWKLQEMVDSWNGEDVKDWSDCRWVNKMLKHIWPYIQASILDLLRFEVLAKLQESFPCQVNFHRLNLGDAPTITGIRTHPHIKDRIRMDLHIELAKGIIIELRLGDKIAGFTVPLKDFECELKMRLDLGPLLSTPNFIGGAHISLLQLPKLKYEIQIGFVGNIIKTVIDLVLKKELPSRFLWPRSESVSFRKRKSSQSVAQTNDTLYEMGQGLLKVVLRSGADLIASDRNMFLQKTTSDPYVIMSLGNLRKESSIKRKTLNPTWNETQWFNIGSIHDNIIEFQTYDWDANDADDFIGRGSIDCLEVLTSPEVWFHKNVTLQGENIDRGTLQVDLRFFPWEKVDGKLRHRTGVITFELHSLHNFVKTTHVRIDAELNGEVKQSKLCRRKRKSANIKMKETFLYIIENPTNYSDESAIVFTLHEKQQLSFSSLLRSSSGTKNSGEKQTVSTFKGSFLPIMQAKIKVKDIIDDRVHLATGRTVYLQLESINEKDGNQFNALRGGNRLSKTPKLSMKVVWSQISNR
eukprot:g2527.t1